MQGVGPKILAFELIYWQLLPINTSEPYHMDWFIATPFKTQNYLELPILYSKIKQTF